MKSTMLGISRLKCMNQKYCIIGHQSVLYKIGGHIIFILSIGLYHEEIKKEGTSQFLLDLVNPADMHFSCQSDLSVQ
jgi:hypothetical protein